MTNTVILLIQLGTPDAPDTPSVRRYLREFLSDPRVIDLPAPMRALLVHGWIAPFRAPKSAKAYQSIWTPEGSPLRVLSLKIRDALQTALGGPQAQVHVKLAMRYGNPNITSVMDEIHNMQCDKLIVLPLYPQYASSSTGTALQAVFDVLKSWLKIPAITTIDAFYQAPWYIAALSALYREPLHELKPDALVLSYHGLPIRHLSKIGCPTAQTTCQNTPCPQNAARTLCYRAQCFETSRLLENALQPGCPVYTTFQSQLGRTPWITPSLSETFSLLHQTGHRHIAVACPSFTVDCLETLEEIGIRAKAAWQALSGGTLTLLPCFNDDATWIAALSKELS